LNCTHCIENRCSDWHHHWASATFKGEVRHKGKKLTDKRQALLRKHRETLAWLLGDMDMQFDIFGEQVHLQENLKVVTFVVAPVITFVVAPIVAFVITPIIMFVIVPIVAFAIAPVIVFVVAPIVAFVVTKA
jgi:hypothetical protein